jgi:gamma-glutamyltranspeptidase
VHADGSTVHVEGGWEEEAVAGLAASGTMNVVRWSDRNLFFGGVSAVEVRPDGTLAAAGDPRRGGHGIVV